MISHKNPSPFKNTVKVFWKSVINMTSLRWFWNIQWHSRSPVDSRSTFSILLQLFSKVFLKSFQSAFFTVSFSHNTIFIVIANKNTINRKFFCCMNYLSNKIVCRLLVTFFAPIKIFHRFIIFIKMLNFVSWNIYFDFMWMWCDFSSTIFYSNILIFHVCSKVSEFFCFILFRCLFILNEFYEFDELVASGILSWKKFCDDLNKQLRVVRQLNRILLKFIGESVKEAIIHFFEVLMIVNHLFYEFCILKRFSDFLNNILFAWTFLYL